MLSLSTKERKAKFNTDDLILRNESNFYQAMMILNTSLLNH